jgi:hypothetical protein
LEICRTKLENDGKTKDAKSAVEDIIEKARKDKNTSQIVKAFCININT